MGLLDRFRKEEIKGTRVLLASLDPNLEELLAADRKVYQRFYPATTNASFNSLAQLEAGVAQKCDVLHLFCAVAPDGLIADPGGARVRGDELVGKCVAADVKLLWLANPSSDVAYGKGFSARGQKINLVLTLGRMGPNFGFFLDSFLAKLTAGEAVPDAWKQLHPDKPDSVNPDPPNCLFFPGRGGVRLLK
jgi:hypothetical protein